MYTIIALICSASFCLSLSAAEDEQGTIRFKTLDSCEKYLEDNFSNLPVSEDAILVDAQCISWTLA